LYDIRRFYARFEAIFMKRRVWLLLVLLLGALSDPAALGAQTVDVVGLDGRVTRLSFEGLARHKVSANDRGTKVELKEAR